MKLRQENYNNCYRVTLDDVQCLQTGALLGRTSSNTVDSVDFIRSLTHTQLRNIKYDLKIELLFRNKYSSMSVSLLLSCCLSYWKLCLFFEPVFNLTELIETLNLPRV